MDRTLEILEMTDKELMLKQLYAIVQPQNGSMKTKMWKFYLMEVFNWVLLLLLTWKIQTDTGKNIFQLTWTMLLASDTDAIFPKSTLCTVKTSLSERDFLCQVHINYHSELLFTMFCVWIIILLAAGLVNTLWCGLWNVIPWLQKKSICRTSDLDTLTLKLAHVGDILPAGNRWLLAKVAEILPTLLYTELIEMLDRLEEGPFGWQQRTDAGEEEADNGDKN